MSKKAKWTGDIVAMLHVNGISQRELAAEMGLTHNWVSSVLNEKRYSPDIEHRMREAIARIITRREAE